ncbi:hypothetical protein Tco_1018729 [Tanacetum coccineum]|uniref:Uncharacterized protein n=1 Tax=Tanacetum coccineum TaxID=301880 RepID=A0ABQ5FW90_9ASTR
MSANCIQLLTKYNSINHFQQPVPFMTSDTEMDVLCPLKAYWVALDCMLTGIRNTMDLWQAVILFKLAWLDFHELVLMDDLWSIGNHDFVVENECSRNYQCSREGRPTNFWLERVLDVKFFNKRDSREILTLVGDESVFSAEGTTFCLGGTRGRVVIVLYTFLSLMNEALKRHFPQTSTCLVCEVVIMKQYRFELYLDELGGNHVDEVLSGADSLSL